ncbi:hypothetical protein ACF0H5_023856 [Mactra antiquata]
MQSLFSKMSRENWMFFEPINVRSSVETENCYITDMCVVSDLDLVIIDQNNKSVKLVDIKSDFVAGCLKFETIPYSITKISNKQVCVTFPSVQLIRLITVTKHGLYIHRTLNVNGFCVATVYRDGKLYVSYKNPTKFEILNKDGSVARLINIDEAFSKLCTVPRYFTVAHDGKRIYVTDLTRDVVLCTDFEGKLINSFAEENLDQPHGVIMSTANEVYMTDRNNHTVMKFDKNLNKATPMLTKKEGLRYPTAICITSSNKSLYISSASMKPEEKNYVRKYCLAKTFKIENVQRK